MVDNYELVRATETYRTARKIVKQAQRVQLEAALQSEKAVLGKAIVTARSERGLTIDEVGLIIGIKNRTFIYDMINAYLKEETPVTQTTETEEDTTTPYTIEYFDDTDMFEVKFGEDEIYFLNRVEGTRQGVEVPEEWVDHTKERRALYKDILAEIRGWKL